jgi:exosortase A
MVSYTLPENIKKNSPIIVAAAISLMVSFLYCYFQTIDNLIRSWSNTEEYSHGFFIFPISAYVVWLKKDKLLQLKATPSYWGLGIAAASLIAYIISKFAGVATLASLTMLPFISGSIIYLYGFQVFKEMLFPIGFLIFMIPIPSQIMSSLTIPLQLLVSKLAVVMTKVLQIPVFREGNVIHLPDYTMQVVDACSGLRSMISLLTLSTIFSYLTVRSNILRVILCLSGIPIAILVNIIRVFLTIIVYYYFHYNLAEGTIHTVFGLFIFVLALVFLVTVKGLLKFWEKG